ncbi:MAG: hypothetical protein KIT27_07460 [Legionellales bacterium]|nr:hypothetical protein [Legionellales bacterium]
MVMVLKPDVSTILVSYGNYACDNTINLALALNQIAKSVQVIFLCGLNKDLEKKLIRIKTSYYKIVISYCDSTIKYYQVADLFIGKPGASSISEALRMRLPMFLEIYNFALPNERYNAEWIVENGLGFT